MKGWTPANTPPQIEPGTLLHVAVAERRKGKWYVFGAVYLNQCPIDEEDGEGGSCLMTGFCIAHEEHDYYDRYFEMIDVPFWHPLPDPPTEEVALA